MTGGSPRATTDVSALPLLRLRVRQGEFETAASVLARLAIRNGYPDARRLFARIAGLRWQEYHSSTLLAAIVSRLNGCDEAALLASSRRSGCEPHLAEMPMAAGWTSIDERVCVECMREDVEQAPPWTAEWAPFRRDWWQFVCVACCPRHAAPLVAACLQCRQRLDPKRPRADRCRCGADLLEAEVRRLSQDDVRGEAYLLGRLGRGRPVRVPLLDGLAFGSAAGLMQNLGAMVGDSSGNDASRSDASPTSLGLAVLSQGWEAYEDALSAARVPLATGARARRFGSPYGRFERWLGNQQATDLEPFRERLVQHRRGLGVRTAKPFVFGEAVEQPEWYTLRTACRDIGRPSHAVLRVMKSLGLDLSSIDPRRDRLVAASAVPRIKEIFDGLVRSVEACVILGCNLAGLNRLRNSGILVPFCDTQRNTWDYYWKADVTRVAKVFMSDVPEVDRCPPGLRPLWDRHGGHCSAGQVAVLAIWEGRMTPVALLVVPGAERSIADVLVSSEDLARVRAEDSAARRRLAEGCAKAPSGR